MRFVFFSLVPLIPLFASAAEPTPERRIQAACQDASTLQVKILSCTDNVIAEKAASACREALLLQWKNANAELSELMSVAEKSADSQQQAKFRQMHGDMQLAILKLASLITLTEDSTEKLSQYPRIMFDNPYASSGLAGSSNCYKDSFLAIGKIVKDLDAKADEGEDALAAANKLREVSQARDDGIAVGFTHVIAGGHSSEIEANHAQNRASDITGLEENKAKERSVTRK